MRGRIVIFAGPSLPIGARPQSERLVWLPPAIAGDAYRVETERPAVVVLVDGMFDRWPAIRHKELIHLMAAGVPVVGGASMGALRAAELSDFGMLGVGEIYRAYARGRLTGDDEVAVLHGPRDLGWAALTEPMVNVRATVLAAVRRRVVDISTGRLLLTTAADMFYKTRTWASLLEALDGCGSAVEDQLGRFEDWLPSGRVNLKQRDALACIDVAMALRPEAVPRPGAAPLTSFVAALMDQVTRGLTAREGRALLN